MFLRCEIDTRIVQHEFTLFLFPKYSLFVTGIKEQNWKKIICSPDLSILVCLISTLNLAGGREGADKERLLGLMEEKYVHLFPFGWRGGPLFEIIGMWHFPEPRTTFIKDLSISWQPLTQSHQSRSFLWEWREFPRTNHHLATARGMQLRIWGSPWTPHLDGIKPNSRLGTDILASEEHLAFLVTCII